MNNVGQEVEAVKNIFFFFCKLLMKEEEKKKNWSLRILRDQESSIVRRAEKPTGMFEGVMLSGYN